MRREKKIALIGLTVLLALPLVSVGIRYRRLSTRTQRIEDLIPAFAVEHRSGPDARESRFRQVFVFFKPSCSHCLRTIANLSKLYEAHPDWFSPTAGLKVSLFDISNHDRVPAGIGNAPFGLYRDASAKVMFSLRGCRVPYIVLVDEKNAVRHTHSGEMEYREQEKLIEEFYLTGAIHECPTDDVW
jgi:hypothetical protein